MTDHTASLNHRPPRLYFTACSGIVPARQSQAALPRLRQAGFQLENTVALERSFQRFAGSDEQRLSDLSRLIDMPALPDIILAARGGYGAARLLPLVDWPSLASRLKESRAVLMGYSDFTAIQLALLAKGGAGSFCGPMLGDFGAQHPSAFAIDECIATLGSPGRSYAIAAPQAQAGSGEGLFWGGNLSVLASLVGTPYFPDIQGGLLFLEDVGEQPYRLERMLQQLSLAGVLRKQQAIFLGDFGMHRLVDAYDPGYDLNAVIKELRHISGVPVYTDLPFGHIADKTTLPLGFRARYQADADGLSLSFDAHPYVDLTSIDANALKSNSMQSA
ncbi:LD-carboxypeptidase [Chromobacterium sp. IIBBL 290-4]|uniref:LD-carboxypeptidase n=1 Tax=Chromobacterium sp. IIBBL 290-4 TaxID=2953890 RepID=UPI0020B746DF|nr:LD-carboxypeptidase [Chromobacterium sp. IIBBL 290-4]UTH73728.1 LD-carboxypeptidase [Chromobacterium sp. IIBBL 290-4]